MSMRKYVPALNIAFLNDYHGHPNAAKRDLNGLDVSHSMILEPTITCQKNLRRLGWLFRPMPYGGSLIAQVKKTADGELEPFISIDQSYSLLFRLVIRNPYFTNFTHLTREQGQRPKTIYYFSNKPGNVFGDTLFLTGPLPTFNVPKNSEYEIGHLVTYNDTAYEAIRYIPKSSNTYNPAKTYKNPKNKYWMRCLGHQYVSQKDKRPEKDFEPGEYTAKAIAFMDIFVDSTEVISLLKQQSTEGNLARSRLRLISLDSKIN